MLRVFNRSLLGGASRTLVARFFGYQERASKDFIKKVVSETKPTDKPRFSRESQTGDSSKRQKFTPHKEEGAEKTIKGRRKSKAETNEVQATGETAAANIPTAEGIIEDGQEQKEKPEKEIGRDQFINFEPVKVVSESSRLVQTQYGVLRVPQMFKMNSHVYYLVNSTNINFVKGVLMNDPGALLLFPPVIRRLSRTATRRTSG